MISGVEALFTRINSDGEDMRGIVLNEWRWSHAIGYMVNLDAYACHFFPYNKDCREGVQVKDSLTLCGGECVRAAALCI